MQLTSTLVLSALAAAVSAQGPEGPGGPGGHGGFFGFNRAGGNHAGNNHAAGNRTLSGKAACGEIQRLTRVMDIANNQTLLDKVAKGNATKEAKLKDQATAASAQLTTLTSNATLMTECNSLFATESSMQACGQMRAAEHMIATANNATMLSKITKDNATKAADFQAKASSLATTLATMQSNTTLLQFCAVQDDQRTCKTMESLAKDVQMAGNTTKLNAKFNGNETKIAEFQARAAKAQTKLNTLSSNSTLMAACNSTKLQEAVKAAASVSTTTSAAAAASSSTGASAGAVLQFSPSMMGAALAATMFGVLML